MWQEYCFTMYSCHIFPYLPAWHTHISGFTAPDAEAQERSSACSTVTFYSPCGIIRWCFTLPYSTEVSCFPTLSPGSPATAISAACVFTTGICMPPWSSWWLIGFSKIFCCYAWESLFETKCITRLNMTLCCLV